MTLRKRLDSRPRNEDGATLAFVALLLFVFLGVAALAVDLGRLMSARTQAQRTADAAAMAGAAAFTVGLEDEDDVDLLARTLAVDYGDANPIMGEAPVIRPDEPADGGDVDVEYDDAWVHVSVLRTSAYGGPISNIFARAIGVDASDVSAVAAAQAFPAGKVTCPLPWALIDRWYYSAEGRLASQWADPGFDPASGDVYHAGGAELPYTGLPSADNPTGWGLQDKGTVFRIKPGDPNDAQHPGWYYPVVVGSGPGGNEYENAIENCDRARTLEIGEEIDVEPGAKIGPTDHGVTGLIGQDPTAHWDDGQNCLMHTADARPDGSPIVRDAGTGCTINGSPRLRPLAVLSPEEMPEHGRRTVTVRAFAAVFALCTGPKLNPDLQSCENGNKESVWLRFVQMTGEAGGNLPPDPNSPIQFVQLVQ